jgi:hypothetical protein
MTDKDIFEKIITAIRVPVQDRVLIGFDGYIDRMVRLKKNQKDPPDYFESISDFSGFLQEYSGKSMDIGTQRINEKIGGNGPLMAESLAAKKIRTCCIGAFGYPDIIDIFEPLAKKCSLISVEQACFNLAIEFNDAKIMLGENESLGNIDWKKITTVMGEEELFLRIDESEIFCFTNWSGLSKSNDILMGLVQFVCPRLENKKKKLFFDLADPSCKTDEQFAEFFELLQKLSVRFDITLGLNVKEMVLVYNKFFHLQEKDYSGYMMPKLAEAISVKELVVHGTDWAAAIERGKEIKHIKGTMISNPRCLTGAGDNFNAGYCLGKLYSLDITACLYLGNISAYHYVKDGVPAGIPDIITHIEENCFQGE